MCFHRRVFAEKIIVRTKAHPGGGITVANVDVFIPYQCTWGWFAFQMPYSAFLAVSSEWAAFAVSSADAVVVSSHDGLWWLLVLE
jgi:hypothetical protein